jgi:spore coat polysaccharide biosynthesis protein SpsF
VTAAILIQARMSSRRLPGKILAPIKGKPLLLYLVERAARADAPPPIVCTSDQPDDDPVAALCADRDIGCHRGSLDDVAGRMLGAARDAGADRIVRISGDSPLLDPALIDDALARLASAGTDMASNVWPRRSFPKGQSVEALRTDSLAEGCAAMTERYRIAGFAADADHSSIQLSVDTPSDFARVDAIISRMTDPHWHYDWRAVLDLNAEVEAAA